MTDGSVGAPPGPGRGAEPGRERGAPGAVGGVEDAAQGTVPSAPRFAFRVTRGHAELSLSKPLRGDGGYLTELVLEPLGLSFPLDLSGGMTRFRHRATRVRSAQWSLPLGGLSALARARGVRATVYPGQPLLDEAGADATAADVSRGTGSLGWLKAVGGTHVYVVFEDAFGHVGVDFCVWGRGQSIHLWPASMHAARPSPSSAFARVFVLMSRLGAEWDERAGDFRVAAVASGLLAEALVVRGWRLPRIDAATFHLRMDDAGLALRLGLDAESAARPEVWAKVLAPVYRLWSEGETLVALDTLERAEKALVRQVERSVFGGLREAAHRAFDAPDVTRAAGRVVGGLRAALLAELSHGSKEAAAQLGGLGASDAGEVAARLRLALSVVDDERGSSAVSDEVLMELSLRFAEVEQDSAFVANVLRAAAEVPTLTPASRARLLREALEQAPADVEVLIASLRAGQLSKVASRRAAHDLYGRLQRALALCPSGGSRADLASRAAAALIDRTHPALAVSLLRDAVVETPTDPEVLEALTHAELALARFAEGSQKDPAGRGDAHGLPVDLRDVHATVSGAATRARAAADAYELRGDERRASILLALRAELLEHAGEWEASAEALTHALRCDPEQPRLVVALFRVHAHLGRHAQAAATLHRLVAHAFSRTDEWAEGLAQAAIYFLRDADDPVAARPFVSALQRLRQGDPAVAELASMLARRETALAHRAEQGTPALGPSVSDADWSALVRGLSGNLSATVPGTQAAVEPSAALHGSVAPTGTVNSSVDDSWATLPPPSAEAAHDRPTLQWMRESEDASSTGDAVAVVPAETLPGLSLFPEEAPLPRDVADVVTLAVEARDAGDMALMRGALRRAREALGAAREVSDARALVTAQEVLRRVLTVALAAVGEGPAHTALLAQLRHLEREIEG